MTTHGGKRDGAGRHSRYPCGPAAAHTFRIPQSALEILDDVQRSCGLRSKSQALEHVIRSAKIHENSMNVFNAFRQAFVPIGDE